MREGIQRQLDVQHSDLWTMPNAICAGRIIGSCVLVFVAWQGWDTLALCLVCLLIFSDWIDGKIAVWFNQRSKLGARIDSAADACLYLAALVSLLILHPAYLLNNIRWVIAGLLAYAINVALCLMKFKKWPSYHTRLAKTSWAVAAVAIFGGYFRWDDWPLLVAASFVIATNVEQILLSLMLTDYTVNVSCMSEAWVTKIGSANDVSEFRPDANSR